MEQDADYARQVYQRAVAANPDYVPAYVRLANLNLSQRRYEEALQVTAAALARQPAGDPLIYLYDAVANERLKRWDAAEKSARLAIECDMAREAPQAEYLLGTLLAARHDVPGALEHLKTYLAIAPHARDSEVVRARIKNLE
jgi:tetratricopeptide (TPR) repeat protein